MVPESSTSLETGGGSDAADGTPQSHLAVDDRGTEAGGSDTLDTQFELLKNERRRIALRVLAENPREELSLDALTTRVAEVEYDKPGTELTRSEHKRVYIAFIQNHVPRMADADVIAYDDERNVVTLTERGADIVDVLDAIDRIGARRYALSPAANGVLLGIAIGFVVGVLLATGIP